jgi:hypothetical protein
VGASKSYILRASRPVTGIALPFSKRKLYIFNYVSEYAWKVICAFLAVPSNIKFHYEICQVSGRMNVRYAYKFKPFLVKFSSYIIVEKGNAE